MWRWKRAPIARLVSLSVIWGGPPVFQVASSQTWGRARPRGETPAPGSAAPPLRSLSHGGFRSRLRSSSCGVEGGACILGSKSREELLGPSGALCCSAGAFGDTSGKPTPQCVHMGSGTKVFQDLVRKSVRRCCGASARVFCPGCGQRVLFVASTLAVPSVTTKVSKSRERRRKSAHQRSLSRVEAIPSLSSPLASLSPVMSLDPQWWTSDGS